MQELNDKPLEAVDVDDLRRALHGAGVEDDRWGAKGGELRPEHVQRAVAGLANRDGGFVVLGAERTAGRWALTGLSPTRDDEPGTWLSRVLRTGLRPLPPVEQRLYAVEGGRWAALLKVAPHPQHVVVPPADRCCAAITARRVPSTTAPSLAPWSPSERDARTASRLSRAAARTLGSVGGQRAARRCAGSGSGVDDGSLRFFSRDGVVDGRPRASCGVRALARSNQPSSWSWKSSSFANIRPGSKFVSA